MISDDIKDKNAKMERLYELLSQRLADKADYEETRAELERLVSYWADNTSAFILDTQTQADCFHVTIRIQNHPFDLIQLYKGDQGEAFLNISPPDENDTVPLQLRVLNELILFLSDGVTS
ncbi:hypothetical protein RYZ26_18160 [Terasakiella sp. A23]|uniref:hypothetical protein n=1 Tax=Terasakiella sp. FCG-A23 TaxID=3080561 RepID=UPI00295458BE|nr:hypothetical protein [Terasakiella sp. A23]MDV7341535.1 hypothetical protein [Terasakiella sp. A23]